jgi:hypothetical protein
MSWVRGNGVGSTEPDEPRTVKPAPVQLGYELFTAKQAWMMRLRRGCRGGRGGRRLGGGGAAVSAR